MRATAHPGYLLIRLTCKPIRPSDSSEILDRIGQLERVERETAAHESSQNEGSSSDPNENSLRMSRVRAHPELLSPPERALLSTRYPETRNLGGGIGGGLL